MKLATLRDALSFGWILALTLVASRSESQPRMAMADSASVDSVKKQITQLVQSKKYEQAAQLYDHLGQLYHQQYGYNKYSLDAYYQGLHYYGLLGDSLGYYSEYSIIGDYYTHDYFMQGTAEKYLTKARQYFERTQNMPKVIESRLGLANIAQKKEPIPSDLITQLRETERLSAQYKQPQSQAYALNLLANTYSRAKMPDSAEYFANRSLSIARPLKINWLVALNHFYLGLVHQFRNESREAIESYRKSFEIAESENNLSMLRELSRHTADSYSRMGDYEKAYEASLKTLDYANRFNTSEQTKSIRLQEYESQINTLAVEKKLIEEQNRTQRVVNSMLAAGLIISILGVGALVFLRRQQKLIAHQETVIAQQQIRELELRSLRAMIEGQEGERSRIARDLHDGLGIQLSRIKLFVEAHQEQLPLRVKETLNQFLDEACTETRLISSNLRPYSLSTFGFIPALEDLVQKLNLVNETKLVLEHYGEIPPLGNEASVMIYRVVQELLNNALKHADARTITVQVMASNETTLISVDDDGSGADFEQESLAGNGIANIHSRIAFLGGQVMWQSQPGKGTSVMISLPIEKLADTSLST
ncbi:tetratricopeptide repeat-containing sensor histidine kinase [Telluribacter humicola]|uniref:tetratricopeptide repeat-containing sensor histidine kinase n=1 Tax=Telluribacter humicola TaxID=1720261 RepID=UPI001A96A53F|nr:sensor histidine kinase [Telluribacter humicola]